MSKMGRPPKVKSFKRLRMRVHKLMGYRADQIAVLYGVSVPTVYRHIGGRRRR